FASIFMIASVSITTKYGQPWVCQPVAAPTAKSQRVMRTVASSCCTVGTAGWSQRNGMLFSSQDPVFGEHIAELFAGAQIVERALLALDLVEGERQHLLLGDTRDYHDAVGIAEYEIAGRNLHAGAAHRHVERHHAPAP